MQCPKEKEEKVDLGEVQVSNYIDFYRVSYIGHIIHCLRVYKGCRTIRRHAILGQSFLNDPLIDTECL